MNDEYWQPPFIIHNSSFKLAVLRGSRTQLLAEGEIKSLIPKLIMQCPTCQNEIVSPATACLHCCDNKLTSPESPLPAPADAPDGLMLVLGLAVPLLGFVLYLVNRKTKPQRARSAKNGALIGLGICLLPILFLAGLAVLTLIF